MTVCFTDAEDEAADVSFRDQWEQWHPNVPLITLPSVHRAIASPIVKYLGALEAHVILDRASRRGTANVVLCRLRYRLEQIAPGAGAADITVPVTSGNSLEDG